jgi:hypothetical protein
VVIGGSTSIAAGATNDNILSGSQWEFLPWPAGLEMGLVGDANGADLRIDIYLAEQIIAESMIGSNANRSPVYPDDFNVTAAARAGSRLKIRVRNTNVAAVVLKHIIRINPL